MSESPVGLAALPMYQLTQPWQERETREVPADLKKFFFLSFFVIFSFLIFFVIFFFCNFCLFFFNFNLFFFTVQILNKMGRSAGKKLENIFFVFSFLSFFAFRFLSFFFFLLF